MNRINLKCPWLIHTEEQRVGNKKYMKTTQITWFGDCYGGSCPFYAEDEIYKNGTKKITVKCVRTGSKEE